MRSESLVSTNPFSKIRVEIEIYNLEDIGRINDSYELKLRNEIEIRYIYR